MEQEAPIQTVDRLLADPGVRKANTLDLYLCDAVHFRLLKPQPVFDLIEARLVQRDPGLYRGYAAIRKRIESTMRGAGLDEKVKACCIRRNRWAENERILYSTELEVWMDLSYPNPWILELYHKALREDKFLHVNEEGPFNPLFIKLLLQKNGFERLAAEPDPERMVRIMVGVPNAAGKGAISFVPETPAQRPHALSEGNTLGEQLANGVIICDREERVCRTPDPRERYLHDVGYRLLGPGLVLLFHALGQQEGPVRFLGKGSGFLTTLGQDLQHPWGWLPEITPGEQASLNASLFPDPKSRFSLLPSLDGGTQGHPSAIPLCLCEPAHLLLPPVEHFFLAALRGPQAARLQASASAFVKDYARITRGLQIPLPTERVIRHWRQQLLAPERDLIRVLLRGKTIPGFHRCRSPLEARRMVKHGVWPTGSYLISKGLNRWWLRLTAPERLKAIRRWQDEPGHAAASIRTSG